MSPRRKKPITHICNTTPEIEALDRFVCYINGDAHDENERLIFNDVPLLDFALESAVISEVSAAHRILYRLLYEYEYLFSYDDTDWIEDINDFVSYAKKMFSYMNIPEPVEFSTGRESAIFSARDRLRKDFLLGLQKIAETAFRFIWTNRELRSKLNLKLAACIVPLKKQEYPNHLANDGILPRCTYIPKWLNDAIIYRDNGQCQYCGNVVASFGQPIQEFHIDHMVPLVQGGTNDATNFILSCSKCNLEKGIQIRAQEERHVWPPIGQINIE